MSFTLQVAFKTGDYKQQVIFIGGLTDGFMATEYVVMRVFPWLDLSFVWLVGRPKLKWQKLFPISFQFLLSKYILTMLIWVDWLAFQVIHLWYWWKLEKLISTVVWFGSLQFLTFFFWLRNIIFFLICRYLEPLAIALEKEKWSLVQILLSSSYSGYGTSSLQQVSGLVTVPWFLERRNTIF